MTVSGWKNRLRQSHRPGGKRTGPILFDRPSNKRWEKGRRKPTGAALRLLDLIRKRPNLLQEA